MSGPWVIEYVGRHTCGTEIGGHFGMHEPFCGYVPIAPFSECVSPASAFDFSNAPSVEVEW